MKRAAVELKGVYESHRWAKEDGSWIIAGLECGTTIVGAASVDRFVPGVEYLFSGTWESHEKFGKQFKFASFVMQQPVTESAVVAYLEKIVNGTGCGLGPVKIRKLVRQFGSKEVLGIIKSEPEKIASAVNVPLESAERAAELLISNEEYEETRIQLNNLLRGRGFQQACVDRAIEDFGVCAVDRIRRDPFTMLVRKYPSAGLARCDQLYCDLGLSEDRLKRQTICLWNQIRLATGSVWINAKDSVVELRRMISSRVNPKKAIRLGLRAKWISQKRDRDGTLWLAEKEDARSEYLVYKSALEIRDGAVDEKPVKGSGLVGAI